MGLITDKITYNVTQRGRKHLGQDRNFDTVALAKLINSPGVQEKVKHGDMLGYFGHWPRIKLGLEPSEGGVIDGKVVSIAPALRTIELSAESDGTVTHRAEFLDTTEGRIAERMFQSKAGGFSSAIDAVPGTSPQIARGFFGYDYVFSPNYTGNRGHKVVLDSIGQGEQSTELMAMLDAAMGEQMQAASIMGTLFDSLSTQHQALLKTVERLSLVNDDLVGRLARAGKTLDSADGRVPASRGAAMEDFERYRAASLEALQGLPKPKGAGGEGDAYLLRRFGLNL